MDIPFYIGLALLSLFIIGIIVWLVRDCINEPQDYPFKHKKDDRNNR
jgi:hypothetical protein